MYGLAERLESVKIKNIYAKSPNARLDRSLLFVANQCQGSVGAPRSNEINSAPSICFSPSTKFNREGFLEILIFRIIYFWFSYLFQV